MDQEEKETGMQTENCREEEEREEGEADREEYRKLCMERERELGRYETWFFDAKYSVISSGCLGIAAFVLFLLRWIRREPRHFFSLPHCCFRAAALPLFFAADI